MEAEAGAAAGTVKTAKAGRMAKAKAEANGKKFEFKVSFYDTTDIDRASGAAYDMKMDEAELASRRCRDWLKLLIGIPAFIALIYFLGWLTHRI